MGSIACGDDAAPEMGFHVSQRVPAIAGPIEPLSQLDGVQLGMTARELKKARPMIAVAGYEGYKEQIGDYRIGYSIPGSWSEEQEVPLSNRLVAVTASRTSPDDSSMVKLWNEMNSKLQTYNGGSADCVRFESKHAKGRGKQWRGAARVVSAVFLTDSVKMPGSAPDSARFYVSVGERPGLITWMQPARKCPEEGVYTPEAARD